MGRTANSNNKGDGIGVKPDSSKPSGDATENNNGVDPADNVRQDGDDHRDIGDKDFTDPNTVDSDAPYGRTKSGRIRNRPVGSAKRGSSASERTSRNVTQTTSSVNSILYSLHLAAATFLKVPELAISESESERLAAAMVKVSEMYDVPLIDPKKMAWIDLGIVASEVYGTRAMSIYLTKNNKRNGKVVTM